MYYFAKINSIYIFVILFIFIISLGIFYIIQKKQKPKEELKLSFEITNLIKALGGKENILLVNQKLSKVTINLKNTTLVDPVAIKSLGASGIIQSSSGVIIIFGKLSYIIAQEINIEIKK